VANLRWSATLAAGIYTAIMVGVSWIFPLFPAQPMLAPIYNPVTHMVPPPFPMMVILPAIVIDVLMLAWGKKLVLQRGWKVMLQDWLLAVAIAVSFVGIMLPVQWHLSKFLLTPAADNWFFVGTGVWPYYAKIGDWSRQFWDLQKDPVSVQGIAIAVIIGIISARLGLWCSRWMLKVRR